MELVGIAAIMLVSALVFWLFDDDRGDVLQRLRGERPLHIDWEIATSEQVIGLLPEDRLGAIRNYSEIASVPADEAERVIDHLLANSAKAKHYTVSQGSGNAAGLRELVAAGDIERAVMVYSDYHGVDEYSAREAIQQIEAEQNDDYLIGDDGEIIPQQKQS
jgi:hypothetical protein